MHRWGCAMSCAPHFTLAAHMGRACLCFFLFWRAVFARKLNASPAMTDRQVPRCAEPRTFAAAHGNPHVLFGRRNRRITADADCTIYLEAMC